MPEHVSAAGTVRVGVFALLPGGADRLGRQAVGADVVAALVWAFALLAHEVFRLFEKRAVIDAAEREIDDAVVRLFWDELLPRQRPFLGEVGVEDVPHRARDHAVHIRVQVLPVVVLQPGRQRQQLASGCVVHDV